jgi:hypothetical protein
MEGKELEELIDDFLLGRIKEEELARLDYLRKSDPEIDQRVRQGIEVVGVLQYARYLHLRRLLRDIDVSDSKTTDGPVFTPWIMYCIFFILSLLALWMWMLDYWSFSSIALRHFTHDRVALVWNDPDCDANEVTWENATRSFKEGDYPAAIAQFQPYLENPEKQVAAYAHWNILLARFGMAGPETGWKEEITRFESAAPEPFKAKAKKLIRIIDSPFYRIIAYRISPQLSVLKPRII